MLGRTRLGPDSTSCCIRGRTTSQRETAKRSGTRAGATAGTRRLSGAGCQEHSCATPRNFRPLSSGSSQLPCASVNRGPRTRNGQQEIAAFDFRVPYPFLCFRTTQHFEHHPLSRLDCHSNCHSSSRPTHTNQPQWTPQTSRQTPSAPSLHRRISCRGCVAPTWFLLSHTRN